MLKKDDFKTIFLTSIGGMLEFYDFVIFGMFAIVLGKTFFPPEGSQALQALSAFTVFAVGYFARPFGGILFGHIGDKYGRKRSFILTILFMGLASFFIALIPSYQNIGITATLLFVVLRIVQGAAIGGEIPSAVVFVKESLIKHGGLACGIIFCFINFGIFFAEITKIITTYFQLNNIANSSSLILINLFVFSTISIPAGFFADKIGPLKVLIIGSFGLLIFGSIFYYSVTKHSNYLLEIMLINNVFMGLVVGVASNYASTLFTSGVRASGLGFSYNISFAIFNGAFLALASFGIAEGFMLMPLALALIVVIICLLVLFFTKDTQQKISI